MNRKIASHLGLESSEGVIILAVQPDGPAHRWGLEKGDVIRRIGRYNLRDLDEYLNLLKMMQPGHQISLLIDRHGRLFFMTVQI
jgi:S1-C subfamily serine protease